MNLIAAVNPCWKCRRVVTPPLPSPAATVRLVDYDDNRHIQFLSATTPTAVGILVWNGGSPDSYYAWNPTACWTSGGDVGTVTGFDESFPDYDQANVVPAGSFPVFPMVAQAGSNDGAPWRLHLRCQNFAGPPTYTVTSNLVGGAGRSEPKEFANCNVAITVEPAGVDTDIVINMGLYSWADGFADPVGVTGSVTVNVFDGPTLVGVLELRIHTWEP